VARSGEPLHPTAALFLDHATQAGDAGFVVAAR